MTRSSGIVSLRHSFWELDLPAAWVDEQSDIAALLNGTRSAEDAANDRPDVQGLLTLLHAHGALTYPADRASYELREVKELFSHLSSAWYAQYYSHPLWERLRTGSLSRNGLVAWLLQTYHLSRSAAMSASRSVVSFTDPGLRAVFARSAVDEYSHCDDHFFLQHVNLPLSIDEIRGSIEFPSNLAFDQQMLRMAEIDPLGHVLAGLFQESTARFYDDYQVFYGQVAAAYDLPGYFRPWENHVEIDLRDGHANHFGDLLGSAERRDRADVLFALQDAWLVFGCLESALDDALTADRDDDRVIIRLPISSDRLVPTATALLEPYGALDPATLQATSAGELHRRLTQFGFARHPATSGAPAGGDLAFIRADVALSIFRALSHATRHEEVLLLGSLAEHAMTRAGLDEAVVLGARLQPLSPHSAAFANFLREHAARPVTFVYLLRHAHLLSPEAIPVSERGLVALARVLESPLQDDAGHLVTLTLQLNELHARWSKLSGSAVEVDFFGD